MLIAPSSFTGVAHFLNVLRDGIWTQCTSHGDCPGLCLRALWGTRRLRYLGVRRTSLTPAASYTCVGAIWLIGAVVGATMRNGALPLCHAGPGPAAMPRFLDDVRHFYAACVRHAATPPSVCRSPAAGVPVLEWC
jgi:hypothetical protein